MKDKNIEKNKLRLRRTRRIKRRLFGTSERPRLVVYRSHKHIYAQLVDDASGATLVASSTQKKELKSALSTAKSKVDAGKSVGMDIATEAKKKKINSAIFDRNGYLYHGRVKAVAEGARENGLKI